MVAKELSLFIHAYTFRIDKLPDYALSYNDLLKIFIHDLKLEGLFTDFPDLTLNFIKNNALLNKFNFWLMYCIGIFFWLMY
jgi:glycerophosphoryl diester phosphodiesterase